jgi:hypothetical protein
MLIAARSSQDFCLLLIMTRDHESMLEVFFSFRNIRLGQHQRRPCLNCSRFQLLAGYGSSICFRLIVLMRMGNDPL